MIYVPENLNVHYWHFKIKIHINGNFFSLYKVFPSSETLCQWQRPSSSACSESTLISTTSTLTQ